MDFSEVFQRGLRVKGRYQTSHLLLDTTVSGDRSPKNLARLAVVASKRSVDKRAVVRNRVKRRFRPLMRELAGEGFADSLGAESETSGLCLKWVIRANKSSHAAASEELRKDVEITMQKFQRQLTSRES